MTGTFPQSLTRTIRRPARVLLAAVVVLVGPVAATVPAQESPPAAARPFVEEVWPGVLERGRTNRITLHGTGLEQAAGLWTSVPGHNLAAEPVTGGDGTTVALDVDVPADAPLGLYGLRLATASGLSNACLFLIDELEVSTHLVDAGASAASTAAVPLDLPACVAAKCRPAAIDRYPVTVQEGQQLSFEVIGNRFGRNYDPLVTIRDASGMIVARCDNSPGLFFDCRFSHRFAAAGTYTVEVSDARYEGNPRWNYVLRIGEFPAVTSVLPSLVPAGLATGLQLPHTPGVQSIAHVPADSRGGWFFHKLRPSPNRPATWIPLEVGGLPALFEHEPNNSRERASSCSFPASLNGVLAEPGDEDWYQLELTKGETIRVQGVAAAMGSAADLELVLYEPVKNGDPRQVQRQDETSLRDRDRNTTFITEAGFTFGVRFSGTHYLLVRDLANSGGPGFSYRVDIERNGPRMTLTSDVTRLSIPANSYQPLPLTVKREGFAGHIQLSLIDAQPGLTLEPTVIPEDQTEVVCRLQAEPGTQPLVGTVQVVGRALAKNRDGSEEVVTAVAFTHPLVDRQLRNKDRILYALRIDQRRLPPTLHDRIAVQVVPSVPYDVVLPEQQVLMAKYLEADFPIEIRREPGFDSPAMFDISGGQIGDEAEERVQVYGRIPVAAGDRDQVTARLFNRILTTPLTHRVDLTATARHGDRWITLTRTFTLEVRPAFRPKFEANEVDFLPGESRTVRLSADRVAGFDGEIELKQTGFQPGITVPEQITIPAGKGFVEVPFSVAADHVSGRRGLRYESTGQVGGYQERVLGPVITVIVQKPPKTEEKK